WSSTSLAGEWWKGQLLSSPPPETRIFSQPFGKPKQTSARASASGACSKGELSREGFWVQSRFFRACPLAPRRLSRHGRETEWSRRPWRVALNAYRPCSKRSQDCSAP